MANVKYITNGATAENVIDLSDADDTTAYLFDAPSAGKILLNESFAVAVNEAMGSMTTTPGVGSIEIGGTEYATIVVTASDAEGTSYTLTEAATVGDDGAVYVSAGDSIEFITKTQAVDGTITGELQVFLACVFANV